MATASGGSETAVMMPPPCEVPEKLKSFAMKDLLFIQTVQKYNSRAGRSERVLLLRPQALLLASVKPVCITRNIRLQKISEILIEKTGQVSELGFIIKDDFGVKLMFPKNSSPTADDFLRTITSILRAQNKMPPKITPVPGEGKTSKQDGLHSRMNKKSIKKPPKFVPPFKQAEERKRQQISQSSQLESPREPPPPPEGPAVEMQGMSPTPVASPESPPMSPPPPEDVLSTSLAQSQPQLESKKQELYSSEHQTSIPPQQPPHIDVPQQAQIQPPSERKTGGSDGYVHYKQKANVPPLQVVNSSPYYVDSYRPVKNRVDFNQLEGVISDSPHCESPHSHYSLGSPTELNLQHHNSYKGDWLMRSMADALELEITDLEETNQKLRLDLIDEKELRHKNELALHEKVATLVKRVDQQQRIIDMYEQRDVLKERLTKGDSLPSNPPVSYGSVASSSPVPLRSESMPSHTSQAHSNVEQQVRQQLYNQQQYPYQLSTYHAHSSQTGERGNQMPRIDNSTPVFSTESPPRYCPAPIQPHTAPVQYDSVASAKSSRLLNLI